jgi:hypothetical protein
MNYDEAYDKFVEALEAYKFNKLSFRKLKDVVIDTVLSSKGVDELYPVIESLYNEL